MEKKVQLKRIKGFSDYIITNNGMVISTKNGNFKELTSYKRYLKRKENDYKQVYLYKDGKRYKRYVHRLVYETFVGEISKDLQINHKDLDKSNNEIENLELVTLQENIQHYWTNK